MLKCMKITDGGYFFELIFDISNVIGKLQVHLQESTGELDQRLNAFSARRSPWFSHWAPPARNSHKTHTNLRLWKPFRPNCFGGVAGSNKLGLTKAKPRGAFLLHSNKFTFPPTSPHSHPHSQSQSLFPAETRVKSIHLVSASTEWRPGGWVGG